MTESCWLTDNEEENKADDEEWGAADSHTASKLDEGGQQQRGPEQEVEQRPWSAARDYCRSGKLSHLVVMFLQGILNTSGQGRSAIIKVIRIMKKQDDEIQQLYRGVCFGEI